ncbi:MAG: hypothetical protein M0R80_02995 [Proteobacteria bacterium]|jgi:hypothetical protein|nr:hypothetical protein [Pseudomonadota bacterium]
MKTTPIDHGFLQISQQDALALAKGKLPRHGYETLVNHEGEEYWLARTPLSGKLVWSIRPSKRNLPPTALTRGSATPYSPDVTQLRAMAAASGDRSELPYRHEGNIMKFGKWVELRECDGRPTAPHGMKKCACDEKKSKGTRDLTKDLSADYKGHVAQNGTVEPFKVLGNKGKSVAPVGK